MKIKVKKIRKRVKNLKYGPAASRLDHTLSTRTKPGETVVVSGFWRSGTTWLQEWLGAVLQAKTIFEPFHFMVPMAHSVFVHYGITKRSTPFKELFIPYCGAATLENHFLYDLFDRMLRGDVAGKAARMLRTGIGDTLRRRVVVKLTRGQFCLRPAQASFGMPVIHVYRDPRAVIASIKMTNWSWLFNHLSLREQLLDHQDGRAHFFSRWTDEIHEMDKDKISRVAAYWALTERYLQDAFAGTDARTVSVSYEELCQHGNSRLVSILNQLQIKSSWNGNIRMSNSDSYSTSEKRKGISANDRIFGWKKILSPEEQSKIAAVASHFGLEERLAGEHVACI